MTIKSPKVKHLKWSLFNITHSVIIQISHCKLQSVMARSKIVNFASKWSIFTKNGQTHHFLSTIKFLAPKCPFSESRVVFYQKWSVWDFLSRKTTCLQSKKMLISIKNPEFCPQKYFILKMSFFRNWSLSGWWNLKGNIITMLN